MTDTTPSQRADQLLAFFKLFSDVERLKIAGLLAQHAHTVEDIAAALALPHSDVVHHLARLSAAGLAREVSPRVYEFLPRALEDLAHGVLAGEPRPAPDDAQDMDSFDRKVVADFFTTDGRLKNLPAQYKKQLSVLRHVNHVFQPGVQYSEKQVNEMLARFHEDTAALRRALVDNKLMARRAGIYWQVGDTTTKEPE